MILSLCFVALPACLVHPGPGGACSSFHSIFSLFLTKSFYSNSNLYYKCFVFHMVNNFFSVEQVLLYMKFVINKEISFDI